MKKGKLITAALALGIILTGCGAADGSGFAPTETSIYVGKDGSLSTGTVENCGDENYRQEAFMSFVSDAVAEFNTERSGVSRVRNGEGQEKLPAAIQSCEIADGRATMILDYATGEDVAAFAEEAGLAISKLEVGQASEASAVGLTFQTADGTEADAETVSQKGGTLIQVEGAATIQVEGKIAYVTEGVTVAGDDTVKTPEGASAVVFQ